MGRGKGGNTLKTNVYQIALLVMEALSEIETVKAGEEVDLHPIVVTSGTTVITLNINVHQKPKK